MVAISVIAVVLALVWGMVCYRQVGLLGAALAVLLVGSCFGHPFYHVNVGPVPITLDRLLLGGLLVCYVIGRAWWRVERRSLDHVDLMLLAFIGMLVLSTFAHDWRANGSRALASLLFLHLMPLALYWVVREAPASSRAVVGVLATLAFFGLYLAVTAVCEQQQWWSLVFPRYMSSVTEAEFLGRGRGPFLNPVANGMYLCTGFFSLLMFWPRVSRRGKLMLLVLSIVYLAGIYCTLTRVVWLAAVVGVMILVVLNVPRRWAVTGVVATGLLGTVVGVLKWDDLNAFKRDQYVSVAEMSESASLRPILAYIAWQMYLDRPLTGCGYRQYDRVADHYLADRTTQLRLERARRYAQHNVFLALLAETGMIGLGFFLLLLATVAQSSWRLWRNVEADLASRQMGLLMLLIVLSYVMMAMFHDLALIPMVHMLVLFLAAMVRAQAPQLSTSDACVTIAPSGTMAGTPISTVAG
jgi:O-antigen ligase